MRTNARAIVASMALAFLSTTAIGQTPSLNPQITAYNRLAQTPNSIDGKRPNTQDNHYDLIASNFEKLEDVGRTPRFTPSTFPLRPSAYSTTTVTGYNSPANAYDGNFTTYSYISLDIEGSSLERNEFWYGFPSKPSGASGMALNVESAAVAGPNGFVQLFYSTDGGDTFTQIYGIVNNVNRPEQIDTIPLNSSIDTTQVQVKAVAAAVSYPRGPGSSASQQVYEIWITGTN